MKTLFILILLTAVFSCKKKESFDHCYHCTFGFSGKPPLDTCSDAPASTYKFKDANNNDLSFFCEEK